MSELLSEKGVWEERDLEMVRSYNFTKVVDDILKKCFKLQGKGVGIYVDSRDYNDEKMEISGPGFRIEQVTKKTDPYWGNRPDHTLMALNIWLTRDNAQMLGNILEIENLLSNGDTEYIAEAVQAGRVPMRLMIWPEIQHRFVKQVQIELLDKDGKSIFPITRTRETFPGDYRIHPAQRGTFSALRQCLEEFVGKRLAQLEKKNGKITEPVEQTAQATKWQLGQVLNENA